MKEVRVRRWRRSLDQTRIFVIYIHEFGPKLYLKKIVLRFGVVLV